VRKFVGRVFHSGGSGSRRSSGIQQPGGDYDHQPNNQQSQLQAQDSGKGPSNERQRSVSSLVRSTLRSLSPFTKPPRRAPETTFTGHARTPLQSDTVMVVSDTLEPASGWISIAAALNMSSSGSQASSVRPTHPPPGTTGGYIVPHVHCSPPQETASVGKLNFSKTAIPASNQQDIATTTINIAPIIPPAQTPVLTPTKGRQPLSTVPQAVRGTNYISTLSPSISSHLWQKTLKKAQEGLAKYKLPSLELGSLQSQSAAENIQSLIVELETAHRENKGRQWRYKDRQGNEIVWVERLGKILKSVDKYAKIVDTAIQHHPDITSLVWAGAKTMLQVCHGL